VISMRYAPAVAVLVGLALVPTILHAYIGFTASDQATSHRVSRQLGGIDGVDTARDVAWVKQYFNTTDFIERRYGADVTLFVARGFDAKALYHHPELGLAYGRTFTSTEVIDQTSSSGTIVLRLLEGADGFACYALLYGNEFVDSPLRFEVRRAVSLLFGPRREMTLFFAHGPATTHASESPVTRIVVAAVDSFRAPVAPAGQ
jgi:hypothetical protein